MHRRPKYPDPVEPPPPGVLPTPSAYIAPAMLGAPPRITDNVRSADRISPLARRQQKTGSVTLVGM